MPIMSARDIGMFSITPIDQQFVSVDCDECRHTIGHFCTGIVLTSVIEAMEDHVKAAH